MKGVVIMAKFRVQQNQAAPAQGTINVVQLEERVKKDLSWIVVSLAVAIAAGLLVNFLFL